jgi:ribosomal protein S18 acetylase RimI-like enzyme
VVRIVVADEVTEELVNGVRRLLPQLSKSARPLTEAEIEEIVASPSTALLLAHAETAAAKAAPGEASAAEGAIVGMLTLVTFRLPTGVRAWIEDVVVDESQRGQGTGAALIRAAIELAAAKGAITVDLTSRPAREAANRLYRRVGFEVRDTNVYRVKLSGSDGA